MLVPSKPRSMNSRVAAPRMDSGRTLPRVLAEGKRAPGEGMTAPLYISVINFDVHAQAGLVRRPGVPVRLSKPAVAAVRQSCASPAISGAQVRGERVRGEPVRGERVRGEPLRGERVRVSGFAVSRYASARRGG